jgi:2-iminobutanoate/2-iminopropanoate deaminase
MKKYVVEQVFKPTGPYVHAVESNGFVFISGIIGARVDETLPDDPDMQMDQLFENVSTILQGLSLDKHNVLKTTAFLKDMAYSAKFNEKYANFFEGDYPARSMVQVVSLPMNAYFEMELIVTRE